MTRIMLRCIDGLGLTMLVLVLGLAAAAAGHAVLP